MKVHPEKLLEISKELADALIEMHHSTAICLHTWPEAWALVHAVYPDWTTVPVPR